MSLRLKLFLAFGTMVLLTIATVVLVARQSSVQELRAFMIRGGMAGSQELIEKLEAYYTANGSWDGAGDLLRLPGQGQGQQHGNAMSAMMRQRLILAQRNGVVLYDTAEEMVGKQLSASQRRQAIALRSRGKTVGLLLPIGGMGAGLNEETNLVSRLNRAAWLTGLIAGSLALILAAILAYHLLRPVGEITQAAEKLAKGDLTQRVPERGQDELARLAGTFNYMADSLQQAQDARRALTADISHELRNPLAVQRANLEALQDGLYPLTPENLQPVLDQNLLLTRLVEDLRTLALAESGQLRLELTPTDLPGLAQRVVEHFEPQAAAQQSEVRFVNDLPPENPLPLMELDPMRIEQILNNLLSNALRYIRSDGLITLKIARQAQAAEITVQDNGTGIPPEALPHIFERFYRADRSRSRSEGGSGLGLAIARELAEAQHGSLTAKNHPQGGAVFTLSFPLSPNAPGAAPRK